MHIVSLIHQTKKIQPLHISQRRNLNSILELMLQLIMMNQNSKTDLE